MSYILDALRRAEAERSSMQPPDLNRLVAASVAPAAALDGVTRRRPRLAWVVLAAILVTGAIGAAFFVSGYRPDPMAPPAVPPPPLAPPRVAQQAVAPPTSRENARTAAPPPLVERASGASAPAASGELPSLDLPRSPVIAREQPTRPVQVGAAGSSPVTTRPAPSTAASPALRQAPAAAAVKTQPAPAALPIPPAAPAASVAAALPSRDELPPEFRRSLPPFAVGGTVYSPDPARRMLIVDGELWREGDQIRPDLVIEQIRPRDAVLRYRGVPFRVAP